MLSMAEVIQNGWCVIVREDTERERECYVRMSAQCNNRLS
jgi:hypothetical protein